MLQHTGTAVDDAGACRGAAAKWTTQRSTALLTTLLLRPAAAEIARPQRLHAPIRSLSLSVADGAATLTAFTAAAIARAREQFPEEPLLWVMCGGGRRNRTLMTMLAARVESAVAPAEAAGFDGDAVEAEAWAYLAVRSLRGLPITFPGTTGVPAPMPGGVLVHGGR